VYVNGMFVDYPPINNRRVASGTLLVAFKWPDGQRKKETVHLQPGGVAFVTGRRDR